jgi:hypothetical protein
MMDDPIVTMKVHQKRVDEMNGIDEDGVVDEGMTAHDYLKKVYQDPTKETWVRMRAASIAIEFELPKLKAAAILYSGDFASRLELAIERSDPAKLIEVQAGSAD